jgi:hypothetical protein
MSGKMRGKTPFEEEVQYASLAERASLSTIYTKLSIGSRIKLTLT